MKPAAAFAVVGASLCTAKDLSTLPAFLKASSDIIFPDLKAISVAIHADPEVGLDEHRASDRIVSHFKKLPQWTVVPHAFNLPTSFEMTFEHRPVGFKGPLKTIGFLAEYDALVGIGHACGHNHISLNGMSTAILTSLALQKFDLPGRIKLIGTPDEENAAGKHILNARGAFDSADVWVMAHPTVKSAIQPMNSRLNCFARFQGKTHQEAVYKAYQGLIAADGLTGNLPGTASSAATIENIGVYATNTVQTFISLGVTSTTADEVRKTLDSILDSTYPNVKYTVFRDKDGIAVNMTGPGGHGSHSTKSPLILSTELFRAMSKDAKHAFYLPGNTTTKELDITIDLRTRYTTDLPALSASVDKALANLTTDITHDVKYPSLELTPSIPDAFLSIISSPGYDLHDWAKTDLAPASTDASWLQNATLGADNAVTGVDRVVFHANYNICDPASKTACAFNHEPGFAQQADTQFSYNQTEIVARAEAQLAIQMLADEQMYHDVTAILKKNQK